MVDHLLSKVLVEQRNTLNASVGGKKHVLRMSNIMECDLSMTRLKPSCVSITRGQSVFTFLLTSTEIRRSKER